jgi:hypothetical protein
MINQHTRVVWFFDHDSSVIRGGRNPSETGPAHEARQGLGLDVTRGAARAAYTHQEQPEAIVELLDVSEHPHARMVRAVERIGPRSVGER